MDKSTLSGCIDPRIGRLLEDAKSDALDQPGREEDRRLFFEEHFNHCQACREKMLDHANELAYAAVAEASGLTVDEVRQTTNEQTGALLAEANRRGVPFSVVWNEKFKNKDRQH